MLENTIRRMPRAQDVARMTTQEVRDTFLVTKLFEAGQVNGTFTDLDRLVVGGIMPTKPLELPNHKETGRASFLERREFGAINVGGDGSVHIDGKTLDVDRLGCVYVPMGSKSVTFESKDAKNPAKFFFLSCPAHSAHPAAVIVDDFRNLAGLDARHCDLFLSALLGDSRHLCREVCVVRRCLVLAALLFRRALGVGEKLARTIEFRRRVLGDIRIGFGGTHRVACHVEHAAGFRRCLTTRET